MAAWHKGKGDLKLIKHFSWYKTQRLDLALVCCTQHNRSGWKPEIFFWSRLDKGDEMVWFDEDRFVFPMCGSAWLIGSETENGEALFYQVEQGFSIC